jgi:hypothetical protein
LKERLWEFWVAAVHFVEVVIRCAFGLSIAAGALGAVLMLLRAVYLLITAGHVGGVALPF